MDGSDLTLDRVGSTALVDQISGHIEAAITAGSLSAGVRLPSWRDLAAQFGVARGTIKAADEQLIDKELLTTAGSAGTHVVDPLPVLVAPVASDAGIDLPHEFYRDSGHALVFQMGVPAHVAFPATLWSRLHRQGVQAASMRTGYGDPHGLSELKAALAAHVAITRGIECSPGADHRDHGLSRRSHDRAPRHRRDRKAGLGRGSRLSPDPACPGACRRRASARRGR